MWYIQEFIIGASLSKPHPYVEKGAVVSARTIVAKNGIATHYCSFGRVVHKQTSTINLRILPYKCIVMQKLELKQILNLLRYSLGYIAFEY